MRCFDLWQAAAVSNLFFSIFCSPMGVVMSLSFYNKCWREEEKAVATCSTLIYISFYLCFHHIDKKNSCQGKKGACFLLTVMSHLNALYLSYYASFQLHLAVRSAHKVYFKWCWLQNWLNVFVKVKIVYCIRKLATIVMTVAPLILMNYMLVPLFMA